VAANTVSSTARQTKWSSRVANWGGGGGGKKKMSKKKEIM
jgi:hypothetical protein